jgi:uncharacterized protein YbjT (DUF2867 family)
MNQKNYTRTVGIFGGSGFVGEAIIERLAKTNLKLKIATRKPYLSQHLKVYGDIGQIELVKIDIASTLSIESFIQDCDICINLIGILFEKRTQKFKALHTDFPKQLATAFSKISKDGMLIHFSALGVKEHSQSKYIVSKYLGEQEVKTNFVNSVIMKPSIIVGPKDNFFNMFAKLINLLPVIPLVGAETKFQPVYVGDVAEAVHYIIQNNIKNETFEIAGNKIFTFKELIELLLKEIRKKRLIIPIPFSVGKIQAFIFQLMPKPILTVDQVTILEEGNNIVSGNFKTLKDLNILPQSIESAISSYLKIYRPKGQFSE